ncbi:MAG: biopolymer transporter ExbD [Flavobacteriales bacterium]|nr:biopolymer transporter ExbD [Flavobacteriales bacterium]
MNLQRKNKIQVEGGMSALSDIIFMLLIFFIMASTQAVNGLQVNLPQTEGKSDPTQATVTVTITPELEFLIDNVPIEKESVELRLKAILEGRVDKKVVLNVDRSVPTGETIELFAVLKKNGWVPYIATKSKEE